ncbi:MAG: energy transducer TonB [Luteimonas sp.]|nr:energy transducer TonB [Luteimonas sp.]
MKNACCKLAVMALLALVVTATTTATAQFRKIAPEAVRKQVEVSMLLTGTIDIERDGSVSGYVLDQREKVPDYVTTLLDRRVAAWQFEPTVRDGQPVAVRSPMSVRMVARPTEDDRFEISISGTSFDGEYSGAATDYVTGDRLDPPAYPMAAIRMGGQGTVYLMLRIGRDGRVGDLFVEQVNLTAIGREAEMAKMREQLSKAAVDAAWKWTFHPPTTGEAIGEDSWAVRVPVEFDNYDNKAPGYGKWQPYLPGQRRTATWAQDDASPDTVAGGGVHPVGDGVKLLTPLQEG